MQNPPRRLGDSFISDILTDLRRLRDGLLRLHKAILDAERRSYELAHGPVESMHTLLQLVMHDPWFGWFRPISEIVVQIDEVLDSDEPVSDDVVRGMFREVRSLLLPTEEGEEFAVKYRKILQVDPDIILAHAKVAELLQAVE